MLPIVTSSFIMRPRYGKFTEDGMARIAKRGTSWVADIRKAGFKSVSRSFKNKGEAVEWSRSVELAMDRAEYKEIKEINIRELISKYFNEVKNPGGRTKIAVIKTIQKVFGDYKTSDLNKEMLTKRVIQRQAEGVAGATIAMELVTFRGLMGLSQRLWDLKVDLSLFSQVIANMQHFGLSTKSNCRDRRPQEHELQKIYDYFNDGRKRKIPYGDIIKFAIATGMRVGEICRIKWSDVDFDNRTVIIRDRKHPTKKMGNHQEVPLLEDSFEIMCKQPKTDDRVFPYLSTSVSTMFSQITRKLGIENLHFHDSRHERLSTLAEKGLSIPQIALVSGHKDWKMLSRYVHLQAKDLHKEFE